jgi:hypothetical protein
VTSVTPRLLPSQRRTFVSANTVAKFSSVIGAVVVLPSDGCRDRKTTATMGTSTTAVMTRISRKRHQRPRAPGSRFLALSVEATVASE